MPIYTYRCKNCGIQFDQRQSFSDQALTHCPECSKDSLHKVYQPVGIVFKGSGFYSTDNRSSSRIRSAGKDNSGEDETKTADKGSKASETKNDSGASSEGSARDRKSGEKSSSSSSNKD